MRPLPSHASEHGGGDGSESDAAAAASGSNSSGSQFRTTLARTLDVRTWKFFFLGGLLLISTMVMGACALLPCLMSSLRVCCPPSTPIAQYIEYVRREWLYTTPLSSSETLQAIGLSSVQTQTPTCTIRMTSVHAPKVVAAAALLAGNAAIFYTAVTKMYKTHGAPLAAAVCGGVFGLLLLSAYVTSSPSSTSFFV